MTFREAEEYLLGLELFGMRFGLDRMHRLVTVLGLPQRRFSSIHVVGTNGKSSTVRYIAALLARHGLRTGSYTSPHLRSFRERIEVSERPVPEGRFAAAVAAAADAAKLLDRNAPPDDRATQFEVLTAAAYHELASQAVDVAVVEAGLGGRYDATNVIPSKVQVLTSVGLEHTRWLGPTVAAIAEEKLAVVRDHGTLVVGPLDSDAAAVAERVAGERHARLVAPNLEGRVFQARNLGLAAAAAGAFLGRPIESATIERAAAETRIPGRLEVMGEHPLTILDGAHNPSGAAALAEALPEAIGASTPLVGVVSVLDDKDAAGVLRALLPLVDELVCTRCSNPRALSPATLKSLACQLGSPPARVIAEPHAALALARELAGTHGAVVATGSIYLIGDLVRESGDARASRL